jgi:hypothetical protein
MRNLPVRISVLLLALPVTFSAGQAYDSQRLNGQFDHVIHISIDGLRPDVITSLGPSHCPNLYRMRIEGIFTDNARSDYDFTNTLPNHVCQVTSRPVNGTEGHSVNINDDNGGTIASLHGSYVAGVFDVSHDNGMATGMYASKGKFDLIHRSWNEVNGAPDYTGPDNGRCKIDTYLNDSDTWALIDSFAADMEGVPLNYSFIHLMDPDYVGHIYGWASTPYLESVMKMDSIIGRVFELVEQNPVLDGFTVVIVTSDHGGTGYSHSNASDPYNYTIPFYVWGPGIPAGADLYEHNGTSRLDPGTGRPDHSVTPQPVRNAEVANLSIDLLGLAAIGDSYFNTLHDLQVMFPGGGGDLPAVSITGPDDGETFEQLALIEISVDAAPAGQPIEKVEFFAEWIKIGEDSSSPYSFFYQPEGSGPVRLAARAIDSDGIASTDHVDITIQTVTGLEEVILPEIPSATVYPNPLNSSAMIRFTIRTGSTVDITIFDPLGREVETVIRGRREPGSHTEYFNPVNLSSGLYFYTIRSADGLQTGKFILLE